MENGHVFIDDGWRILKEYQSHWNAKSQPGPGDVFFKWVFTNKSNSDRVTLVSITPQGDDAEAFHELPAPAKGTVYDPSDRKFLAVAAAHAEHPPILQSFDSKWWGWTAALAKCGVTIHFLCELEIAKKHAEKMR